MRRDETVLYVFGRGSADSRLPVHSSADGKGAVPRHKHRQGRLMDLHVADCLHTPIREPEHRRGAAAVVWRGNAGGHRRDHAGGLRYLQRETIQARPSGQCRPTTSAGF